MEENNQVAANQKPQQTSKAITLLVIIVPVLMILSYFLPWLSIGLPGEKHEVFSVSGYDASQLKPEGYAKHLSQQLIKKFTIDSIASTYRIDEANMVRAIYNTLVDEEAIKHIQSQIETIEETKSLISSKYLARENHTQELINHYIGKEAEAIPGVIKDLVSLVELINKLDEQKIINGEVSKLDAFLQFLKKYDELSFKQANQSIEETKKLLSFLDTIGLERITTNKVAKAEVIKGYLATLSQEKLSADDKQKILTTIEEVDNFLAFLYELGEKNIFENVVTRKDALIKLPTRLDSPLKETLASVNSQLTLIFDEIERTTLAAIVAESVASDTIIDNITMAARAQLALSDEGFQTLRKISADIINSILLLNEKDALYEQQNRSSFLMANTVFPKAILRLTSNQPELQNKIPCFLLYYDLVKYYDLVYKVSIEDFLQGALPDYTRNRIFDEPAQRDFLKDILPRYIRNQIYNVAIQQEFTKLNPEIAELGILFDRVYKLGSENLIGNTLSAPAIQALLYEEITNTVARPLVAKSNVFISIFDAMATYGKAEDLSGEKVSGIVVGEFIGRLSQEVVQCFSSEQEGDKVFSPENVIKEVAGLLPEQTPFDQKVKSIFNHPASTQTLQSVISSKEKRIISELLSLTVKNQIEKIGSNASRKMGFANLIIRALKSSRFHKKLDAEIRKIPQRYPVVYEVHNTLMNLYSDAATVALAAELSQASGFINRLGQAVAQLQQSQDLKQDELEKLTTSKLRGYQRSVAYLDDCTSGGSSIYQNIGAARGKITGVVAEKRLKNLLLTDDRSIDNTTGLIKSIYGMTEIFQKALVNLTYGTRDLTWAFWGLVMGLVLLIVFIISRLISRATEKSAVFILGLVCLVLLFVFTVQVSALSPKILSDLGVGPVALFSCLLALAIAGIFSLPHTTKRTQIILLGGIVVWLGFFLPWTGFNPNALFTWRSGYHLMTANIRPLAPFFGVWDISSSFGLVFPLIAALLMGLILITKRSSGQGIIIFVLSALAITLFTEFVFCIPQASTVWAAGILATSSGFAITVLGTAIRS
ncbi:hypothetical protein ACFL5I_01280 [Planctomycetota bacterium]